MTDLVKRLRSRGTSTIRYAEIAEAADALEAKDKEIERLLRTHLHLDNHNAIVRQLTERAERAEVNLADAERFLHDAELERSQQQQRAQKAEVERDALQSRLNLAVEALKDMASGELGINISIKHAIKTLRQIDAAREKGGK